MFLVVVFLSCSVWDLNTFLCSSYHIHDCRGCVPARHNRQHNTQSLWSSFSSSPFSIVMVVIFPDFFSNLLPGMYIWQAQPKIELMTYLHDFSIFFAPLFSYFLGWMPWTYHSWSGLLSNMLAIELIVVAPSLFASTSTARSLSSAFILPLYSSRIQRYPAAPPK